MHFSVPCAAILAGGQSSRMGRDKALLEVEGELLIARIAALLRPLFPRLCVVTSQEEVARAAQLPRISDSYPGRGPLGGIHAALTHFAAPTFVVACDMPFLGAPLIAWMTQHFDGDSDALVPQSAAGLEPLHAIYAPSCASRFESLLKNPGKTPSLRRVLEQLDARTVPLETARGFDPTLRCFANWNTPEEVEGAARRAT